MKTMFAFPHQGKIDTALAVKIETIRKQPFVDRVIFRKESPVDYNRNLIAKDFLQSDCEYLFTIDSDTVPTGKFWEVIDVQDQLGISIMALPVPTNKGYDKDGKLKILWNCGYALMEHDGQYQRMEGTGVTLPGKPMFQPILQRHFQGDHDCNFFRVQGHELPYIEVQKAGTGAMCIHRSVFEQLDTPYFQFIYNDDMTRKTSEDFDFCNRARQLGHKIYCALNFPCHHWKGDIDLLNFIHYLKPEEECAT